MKVCSVKQCDRPVHCRGRCRIHYTQWRRYEATGARCSVKGCHRPAYCRGWCNLHYSRWRKIGTVDLVQVDPRNCAVDGCDRPHNCRGWCQLHYTRWKRFGTVGQPANRCIVCNHPAREDIELAMLSGEPYTSIGTRLAVGRSTLGKHARNHLGLVRPDGRPCSVCAHPNAYEIDDLLARGHASHAVAMRFGLSSGLVYEHGQPQHQERRLIAEVARLAAVRRYVDA